jgi:hypothetical protein
VPELVLHDLQVRSGGQGKGGCAVPQAVQRDRRQPGLADQAAEQAGQPVRPDWLTGPGGEHVPGLGPASPGGGPLGLLAALMGTQRRDRGPVERDHPASRVAFRRPGDQPPAELLQLLGHRQRPGIQIHVAPPEPGGLAAAQPAQRDQVEQRV